MSVVFIGGSRRLSRLNALVRNRLNNIMEGHHAVIIGDANGSDRAVQAYLADRGYRLVTVYCTNANCRNNEGHWPVRSVMATDQRGFDYYALKDAAMAADADCGFMLWDGKSKGTLFNIRRLLSGGKPVVVYLSSDHACRTIRREADLAAIAPSFTTIKQTSQSDDALEGQGALFPNDRSEKAEARLRPNPRPRRRRVAES